MATAHSDQSRAGAEPLGKDYGNNGYANGYGNNGANTYHMNDRNTDSDTALKRIRTAGSISITPELFEKIYLSPQNAVKGDLRKTFGNPTPLALVGFLLCLSPLSCDLMGWRGAGGNGAAGIGSYFFFGGLLMLLGGFLEFILGNTFPFIVFMSFGAFWLSFAATLQPFYAASASYAPNPATSPAEGLATTFIMERRNSLGVVGKTNQAGTSTQIAYVVEVAAMTLSANSGNVSAITSIVASKISAHVSFS
ncbi:hypothetical protein BUE80_DR008859 [Diplocarpon rosae]|nr:hypothetical protein BUE80_DR008859 [Diplocarpon rosae]